MRKKGYITIDTLILTHYDKDHIGGAEKIISNFTVGQVIESQINVSTLEYIYYHNAMAEKGIAPMKLKEDYTFTYDSCEFEISIPQKKKYSEKQDNNSSLIVSLKCGEKRFLFCGDAMELRLNEFISQNQTKFDFVKLPYHGNYLKNYREFLNSTSPTSVAITNSSKNPTSSYTLEILNEYSLSVYETRDGAINIKTDGKTVEINQ